MKSAYSCGDCGNAFEIEVTPEDAGGTLTEGHTEQCPGCGCAAGA